MGFPGGSVGKESTCQCRRCERLGFNPWVGIISWRRKWQHTPVFLPGKSHGWRSLADYSPWDHKELDTTEWLHFLFFTEASTSKNTNHKWWSARGPVWLSLRVKNSKGPLRKLYTLLNFCSRSPTMFSNWELEKNSFRFFVRREGNGIILKLPRAFLFSLIKSCPQGKQCYLTIQLRFYRIVSSFQGEGNGTPLQYSCLENPVDRGAW